MRRAKNHGQPVTHSYWYIVMLTLFCATTLSAFLPRENRADAAVKARLSSAIKSSAFEGMAHSTCVLKTLSVEHTSVLGSNPFGLAASAEATPNAIPESATIWNLTRVPSGRFITLDFRSRVFSTMPTLPLRTHVYEGVEKLSYDARGESSFAVGAGSGVGVASSIGESFAFATMRGVGAGAGFSSVACAIGISRCSSEYVTAKVTTSKQTIETAISVFIQGDIRSSSLRGA
jgi:hypothetical protein